MNITIIIIGINIGYTMNPRGLRDLNPVGPEGSSYKVWAIPLINRTPP